MEDQAGRGRAHALDITDRYIKIKFAYTFEESDRNLHCPLERLRPFYPKARHQCPGLPIKDSSTVSSFYRAFRLLFLLKSLNPSQQNNLQYYRQMLKLLTLFAKCDHGPKRFRNVQDPLETARMIAHSPRHQRPHISQDTDAIRRLKN